LDVIGIPIIEEPKVESRGVCGVGAGNCENKVFTVRVFCVGDLTTRKVGVEVEVNGADLSLWYY